MCNIAQRGVQQLDQPLEVHGRREKPKGLHLLLLQGRGATRLVQMAGRRGSARLSLQSILDDPPEELYNQWIKERLAYYVWVEPMVPR